MLHSATNVHRIVNWREGERVLNLLQADQMKKRLPGASHLLLILKDLFIL